MTNEDQNVPALSPNHNSEVESKDETASTKSYHSSFSISFFTAMLVRSRLHFNCRKEL